MLRGDGPGHAVRPLAHDVLQRQPQAGSQGQLAQQRVLKDRESEAAFSLVFLGFTVYNFGDLEEEPATLHGCI